MQPCPKYPPVNAPSTPPVTVLEATDADFTLEDVIRADREVLLYHLHETVQAFKNYLSTYRQKTSFNNDLNKVLYSLQVYYGLLDCQI